MGDSQILKSSTIKLYLISSYILYVSVINISCKQKTYENNLKVKDIIVMYVTAYKICSHERSPVGSTMFCVNNINQLHIIVKIQILGS